MFFCCCFFLLKALILYENRSGFIRGVQLRVRTVALSHAGDENGASSAITESNYTSSTGASSPNDILSSKIRVDFITLQYDYRTK